MSEAKDIRVAVVDDLKDVATILASDLDSLPGIVCKQVYYNAEDAMHFLNLNPVDIVLMDIGLPRASGIDAIRFLVDKHPDMQFCMFTVYQDDDKIFESLKAGARGYLLKNATTAEQERAVREVYGGGSVMSPSIARRVIEFMNHQPVVSDEKLPITNREHQILILLADGLTYKEVGSQLGITTGTVKQHIHRIYTKLEVNNRTEALNRLNRNNNY